MWCGGIWVWGGSILAFLGVRLRLKFRNHTFRNHTNRVIVGEGGGAPDLLVLAAVPKVTSLIQAEQRV